MGEEPREQSVTSCEGWPADWVSSHCQTNQDTGTALEQFIMTELGQRMTWGGGAPFGRSEGVKLFFGVVVLFVNPFFSFFEKELSAFVPRENEISMKKGEAGNFVPSEFLLWRLQGKGEESGLRRVQAKMRKEKEFLPRISPIVSQ